MKSNKYHNIINTAPDGIVKYKVMLLLFLFLSPIAAGQQPLDDKPSSNDDFNTLNKSNVSPSMAVIVIVLVVAFLFTGCLAIYIQQCVDNSPSSTRGGPVAITGENRSRRVQARGLDRSIIETFPSFLYSAVKELKIGKGTLECAVCLNEFQEEETLRLLPKCDHVFHAECIDAWLVGHTTCPVCRANLGLDPVQTGNPVESIHEHELEGHDPELPLSTDVAQTCDDVVQVTIPEETTRKNNRNEKFPRSHSTGHSVIQPGDDCERFRLRLPAEIRRQLMARTKLKRATSMVALPRESSSRRGFRISGGGGEGSGSSRYGRFFGPLISRVNSFRLTARVTADGDVTTSNSNSDSKRFFGTAVKPLESLPV